MENLPKRKEIRLKEYDYSQNGRYFVTVCIDKRKNILCTGFENPSPTLGKVVGWFKYNSTKTINDNIKNNGNRIWQRSYYDHIIRNEADYIEKRNYIQTNPLKWAEDEYYI